MFSYNIGDRDLYRIGQAEMKPDYPVALRLFRRFVVYFAV